SVPRRQVLRGRRRRCSWRDCRLARQVAIRWIVLVVVLVAVSTAAAAKPAPRHFYLSLGDSLAYRLQPDKVDQHLPPGGFDTGYTNVLAARLRKLRPKLQVVNYGCPGESTVTFVRGGCPWPGDGGGKLHNDFKGSQLQATLAFLQAHPGRVSPVTLSL